MSDDMRRVIVPKSDQLNAEDFLAGPRTVTIESVDIRPDTEQPVSIHLVGEKRVWRPCKSMSRVLVAAWGPDAKEYAGRSVTLFNDPTVKWGGVQVGGIRISHMSHIQREMRLALTETRGKRAAFAVSPLASAPPSSSQTSVDKVAQGARMLIERIAGCTEEELRALTADATTIKQRAYLAQHRPELAEKVDRAVDDALARLGDEASAGVDDFPGVVTPREDA